MQSANFVTKPSVVAVLPEQRPTSWGALYQAKAGIQTCIAINKKDDDRRAILKNAQRVLSEVMREKEGTAAGKKRKQAVMDGILTPCPVKSAESSDDP